MPSSSRPYRSKILTFLLDQFQQGVERHRRAVRQAKVTATWGLQVALSPVYAVLRATRLAGRQFGQATPGDSPLLNFFRQRAGMANLEAPGQEHGKDDENQNGGPTEVAGSPIDQLLDALPSWLLPRQQAQLQLAAGIAARETVGVTTSISAALPGPIQGIASDCSSRSLLLVDCNNQLWDVLAAEQQDRLQQQILTLVEAYWQQRGQTPSLGQRLISWLPLPAAWKQRWLKAEADRPLLEAFTTVQHWLLPPSEAAFQLPPGAQGGALWQTQRPALPTPPSATIQGVASDRVSRSLVLVVGQNQLWHVLTPEQQRRLQFEIARLVQGPIDTASGAIAALGANAGPQSMAARLPQQGLAWPTTWQQRWRQLLQTFAPAFRRPELSGQIGDRRSMLPTESRLNHRPSGSQNPPPALVPGLAPWPWSTPSKHLKAWLAKYLPDLLPSRPPSSALVQAAASADLSPWTPPAITLETREPPGTSEVSGPVPDLTQAWESEVISIHYLEHPLERLLRWIDQLLAWIEHQWSRLQTWLRPRA
jgi:hypothetical protein